jgi:CBS domain-containing protein
MECPILISYVSVNVFSSNTRFSVSLRNPRTIPAEAMAVEAMEKMESPPPIQFLPVVDDNNVVRGIITLHGLVSAGL